MPNKKTKKIEPNTEIPALDIKTLTDAIDQVNQTYHSTTTGSNVWQTTYPTYNHQHTVAYPPTNAPLYAPPAHTYIRMTESPELLWLIEALKVEPGGSEGILLDFGDGKYYSLINILKAQTELMLRMSTVLMHRNLHAEEE